MSTDVEFRASGSAAGNGNGRTHGSGKVHGSGVAPRRIGARKSLPGSRAVVGGLLVAAAAVGLFGAYTAASQGPRHSYVVASRPIAAGTRLQAGDLTLERMDLSALVRTRAFADPAQLVGATAIANLAPGELVQPSAVVAKAGDERSREMSFPIERGHLSDSLEEGESVDLLATFGAGNDSFTSVVLRDARVVSIERPKPGVADNGSAVLAVSVDDQTDELAVAHALQEGKLTVVRTTGVPPSETDGSPPTYRPSQVAVAAPVRPTGSTDH